MKNLILLLCFFISLNCDKPSPLDVEIYKLDNGLTVMLNEDHNETSVFGAVVVDGGSKRDPSDATGIAHYLEHLLFKGTEKLKPGEFSKRAFKNPKVTLVGIPSFVERPPSPPLLKA